MSPPAKKAFLLHAAAAAADASPILSVDPSVAGRECSKFNMTLIDSGCLARTIMQLSTSLALNGIVRALFHAIANDNRPS